MKIRKYYLLIPIAILIFIVLMVVSHGNAASVRKVNMDEMLQTCQFVFEGIVLSIEAKENSSKRIHTFVTFTILEIIKGDYPDNTITLSFLGGTVGDVTMAVSNMQIPQIEERGIYFVESLDRSQVHPLYGWSQGHFIVEADDTGTDRVLTSRKQAVTGVKFDIPVKQMTSDRLRLSDHTVNNGVVFDSNGVALGLNLAQDKKDIRGLTLFEFKKTLHERLIKTNE